MRVRFELTDPGPQNLLFLAHFLMRGMDQAKGLGIDFQVVGGLLQVVLVAAWSVVKQILKEQEHVLTTCWSCFAFCWRATSQASSTSSLSSLSSVVPEKGSSHVAPHAATSAEGKDKDGLEGDHPTDSAVSGAVSKVPNPSISSAAGIEIDGTIVEFFWITGEGESGVLIRGGVVAGGLTLIGGGVGDRALNSRKPGDIGIWKDDSSCTFESVCKEILSKVEGGGFHAELDVSWFQSEALDPDTSCSVHCVVGFVDQDGVDKSSSLSPCKTETEGADQSGERAASVRLDFGSPHAFAQGSSICAMQVRWGLDNELWLCSRAWFGGDFRRDCYSCSGRVAMQLVLSFLTTFLDP